MYLRFKGKKKIYFYEIVKKNGTYEVKKYVQTENGPKKLVETKELKEQEIDAFVINLLENWNKKGE